jgi:hypothetical protein
MLISGKYNKGTIKAAIKKALDTDRREALKSE